MRALALIVAILSLSGCIPATAIGFPNRSEVAKFADPTETQVFYVSRVQAKETARAALLQNGFVVQKEEDDFIQASERIWSRNWSWDYAAGVFFFEEPPGTRVTVVINGAPDIFMPLTLGVGALAQSAEARQVRIQLLNAIRANIATMKLP